MKAALKRVTPFISILFFGLAVWFLEYELRQHDLSEVARQLSELPISYVAASLVLSFLSYIILTGYDGLGVRYIGESLSTGRIVRAGFISYAFSHNIGLALITGGSIRYRIYSAWGFSALQVTQIVAFSALTLWIGFCTVAGLSLVFATPDLPDDLSVPFVPLQILGVILLAMVAGYIWGSAKIRKEITFRNQTFSFPDLTTAMRQIVLASIDWLMAASVLYVLLPDSDISFFSFTGVFLLAMIIGLFSQVPGGLGVFESVMLVYLSNFLEASTVLGVLLVYRIIYYILPLLTAVMMLGYQEYVTNRKAVKNFGRKALSWFPQIIPHLLSLSVFISGAMLLFTGAVPASMPQVQWLQNLLPIPVIEMSHFLASLIGAALLVLARGIQRRIDVAYHLSVGLLMFGIVFSMFRGADYIEASVLIAMLGVVVPCRDEFYRKASLMAQPLSAGWIAVILTVIFSSVLLGIFSYRNIAYQDEVWWYFTFQGDAPRYIRASVAVLTGTLLFGLLKLLKPRRKRPCRPKNRELEMAESLTRQSEYAASNLVLLRDKELLFNSSTKAFIMYATEGRSWISMGDPVGSPLESEALIWKYRELCDEHDAWPVFYKVREEYLDVYGEVGLTQLKLGEEARIPLASFDPATTVGQEVLSGYENVKKAGYSYEILPRQKVNGILPELKIISNEWLQKEQSREKRFSLGYFDEEYLQHFNLAVVRHENEIVAFSNLLEGAGNYEFSLDLLRYRSDTHEHIVEFLLIETMMRASEEGYEWFNLGMAPLTGMEGEEVMPGWNKMADLIFTYGENFYDFKKIREHKNRFNPVWEPRYLVCPGGLAIPGVLSSLTSLIYKGSK